METFCDQLKAAGEQVFKDHNPIDGLQRADGFRFLTQNLGQAFDLALETRDTRYPVLHAFCDRHASSAATARISSISRPGSTASRPTASPGSAARHGFSTSPCRVRDPDGPGVLHEPFGDVPEANLFGEQLATADDGSFEVYVGGPNSGPELAAHHRRNRGSCSSARDSTPGTSSPARMRIERVDMD